MYVIMIKNFLTSVYNFLMANWLNIVVFLQTVVIIVCFLWIWFECREAQKEVRIDVPEITVDLAGNQTSKTGRTAVQTVNTTREIHTVEYVEKATNPVTGKKEKTDVQIDTSKKDVNVSVNGKEYSFKPDVKEDYKFENGKLVFTQESTSTINIQAPKVSKWSVGYMRSIDGKHGVTVGYAPTSDVRITGAYINDTPYIGVEVPIGSMR